MGSTDTTLDVLGSSVDNRAISPPLFSRSMRSTSPRGRHWDLPRKGEGCASPLPRPAIWSSRRRISVGDESASSTPQRSRPVSPTVTRIRASQSPQGRRRRVSATEDSAPDHVLVASVSDYDEEVGRTEEEEEDYMRQLSKDLCEASADGDLEWLMLIVQSGISINETDYDRRCRFLSLCRVFKWP